MKTKNIIQIIKEEILNINQEGVGDKYLERKHQMPDEFSDFDKKYNAMQAHKAQDEVVYRDGDWILYKNPKSLQNIGKSTRGVIDSEGNLFIENYARKIHHDIIQILQSKGYLTDYKFKRNWNRFLPSEVGFLTVQRYQDGPIAVGHSNRLIYDEEGYAKYFDEFNNFMNKARQKNPNIPFETKLVSTKFGALKKMSTIKGSNLMEEWGKQPHYMQPEDLHHKI